MKFICRRITPRDLFDPSTIKCALVVHWQPYKKYVIGFVKEAVVDGGSCE